MKKYKNEYGDKNREANRTSRQFKGKSGYFVLPVYGDLNVIPKYHNEGCYTLFLKERFLNEKYVNEYVESAYKVNLKSII